MDALSVLCAQLMCDLLAIAKFLFHTKWDGNILMGTPLTEASNARGYEKVTIFDQYLTLSHE